MITKEQAINTSNREFHYTGKSQCRIETGARGKVTVKVTRCRRNGATQTWKIRPNDFRIPVKYGLYEYGEITQDNASEWHLAAECPVRE